MPPGGLLFARCRQHATIPLTRMKANRSSRRPGYYPKSALPKIPPPKRRPWRNTWLILLAAVGFVGAGSWMVANRPKDPVKPRAQVRPPELQTGSAPSTNAPGTRHGGRPGMNDQALVAKVNHANE